MPAVWIGEEAMKSSDFKGDGAAFVKAFQDLTEQMQAKGHVVTGSLTCKFADGTKVTLALVKDKKQRRAEPAEDYDV